MFIQVQHITLQSTANWPHQRGSCAIWRPALARSSDVKCLSQVSSTFVKDPWTILELYNFQVKIQSPEWIIRATSFVGSMTSLALPRLVVQFCWLKLHPALHLVCLSLEVRDAGIALKFTLHCWYALLVLVLSSSDTFLEVFQGGNTYTFATFGVNSESEYGQFSTDVQEFLARWALQMQRLRCF